MEERYPHSLSCLQVTRIVPDNFVFESVISHNIVVLVFSINIQFVYGINKPNLISYHKLPACQIYLTKVQNIYFIQIIQDNKLPDICAIVQRLINRKLTHLH